MDQLKPVATTSHGNKKVFVHPAQETCSHVFVRHDAVKKSLQTLYDGPYLVLKRTEKMSPIEKYGKQSTINIDRLKPARSSRTFICINNFTSTSCSSDFIKAST
ncbi:transposon Tf2-6 polyprotein [Trichonephila clavata]|uniref:Transposon Tf2-6 polyprotein n=1 Tax=Trichonephila clavata TaxID=2740835 RepID=A0A8X6L7B7_TRICU|nr:transposon Tf2-6 polyprotein [Trichonephila clavata]